MMSSSKQSPSNENSNYGPIDEYGFKRPGDFDYDVYDKFKRGYDSILAHRLDRWRTLIGTDLGLPDRSRKLKRFIRKGIPPSYRVKVWMLTSGAETLMTNHRAHYQEMLTQEQHPRVIDQISIDLGRTYPGNVHFSAQLSNDSDGDRGLQTSLDRVLKAFSCSNRDIGYCQGMNYIVGLMLLVTRDEEKSFWLLKVLLETLLPNYFTHSLIGLSMDVMVIRELTRMKAPAAFKRIENLDVCWEALITKWFMCLYSDVFPIDTVLRIWDCMFYEGSKILIRVALTLIVKHEQRLAASRDVGELMNVFKDMVSFQDTLNCHTFMESVLETTGWLSTKILWRIRSHTLSHIEKERMVMTEKREALRKAREGANEAAFFTCTSASATEEEKNLSGPGVHLGHTSSSSSASPPLAKDPLTSGVTTPLGASADELHDGVVQDSPHRVAPQLPVGKV